VAWWTTQPINDLVPVFPEGMKLGYVFYNSENTEHLSEQAYTKRNRIHPVLEQNCGL